MCLYKKKEKFDLKNTENVLKISQKMDSWKFFLSLTILGHPLIFIPIGIRFIYNLFRLYMVSRCSEMFTFYYVGSRTKSFKEHHQTTSIYFSKSPLSYGICWCTFMITVNNSFYKAHVYITILISVVLTQTSNVYNSYSQEITSCLHTRCDG